MDFKGVSGYIHEFFGECNTYFVFIVFLLHDTVVAVVVCADMCAEGVEEAVLGAAAVGGVGGEEGGGATHAEETVDEEH